METSVRVDFALLEKMDNGVASIVESATEMDRNETGLKDWRRRITYFPRLSESSLAFGKGASSFP